jgi:hypothetical protein
MARGFAKLHRSGLKQGTRLYAFHAYLCELQAYYDRPYTKRIGGRGAGRKVQVDLKPVLSKNSSDVQMWRL